MKDKLAEIINHYGINHQQRKLNEEVFELQEAIFDYENITLMSKKHIIEELADVLVLLEQIKIYYELDNDDINSVMEHKINRTLKRLKDK